MYDATADGPALNVPMAARVAIAAAVAATIGFGVIPAPPRRQPATPLYACITRHTYPGAIDQASKPREASAAEHDRSTLYYRYGLWYLRQKRWVQASCGALGVVAAMVPVALVAWGLVGGAIALGVLLPLTWVGMYWAVSRGESSFGPPSGK